MFSLQTTKMRLILSWGEKPDDLDATLVSGDGNCIVNHSNKNKTVNCNGLDVILNTDNQKVSKIMQSMFT